MDNVAAATTAPTAKPKTCSVCGGTDYDKHGNCRACNRVRQAKYRQKNIDKCLADRRDYYHRTKVTKAEDYKVQRADYVEKNRELVYAKNREYQKTNREKLRLPNRLRMSKFMAKQSGVPNIEDLPKDIVERLFTKQNGLCACCGATLGATFHIDHIIPRALGGSHTEENVQLLTPTCNLRKGSKHPEAWTKYKEGGQDGL